MRQGRKQRSSRLRIPNPNSGILTGCQDAFSIRAERGVNHPVTVSQRWANLRSRFNIPNLRGSFEESAIRIAGDQSLAVGTELCIGDRVGM